MKNQCKVVGLLKEPFFQIFKPLLNDLHQLEHEGTAGIAVYSGDNLELNELGMFHRSFSSGYPCRHCVIHYSDMSECDGFLRHDCWDEEKYDAIASSVENLEVVENFSLRGHCLLNTLQSFHAARNFAPDLMHDFMEGKFKFLLVFGLTFVYGTELRVRKVSY